MYTEFHLTMTLRKDTPDDVLLLIQHAIYDPDFMTVYIDARNNIETPHPLTLPPHPFFQTERWEGIFGHHYDIAPPYFIKTKGGYYKLSLGGNINYGHEEIREFIKWISPYVAGRKKRQYIGWYRNEEYWHRNYEHVERPVVDDYYTRLARRIRWILKGKYTVECRQIDDDPILTIFITKPGDDPVSLGVILQFWTEYSTEAILLELNQCIKTFDYLADARTP